MDQSIVLNDDGYKSNDQQPFKADESMVASYRKTEEYLPPDELISKKSLDDVRPHPNAS